MLIGFRAGAVASLGVNNDDFVGTRRALGLADGTAPLGRVFPAGALFGPDTTPTSVVSRASAACTPVLAAKMQPYLSLKPDVTAGLAGQLDAHFAALAKWIAGVGTPVYFSVWHEPENDAMGAGATHDHTNHLGRAKNFVGLHTRAYRIMKPLAGNLRMGPCHQGYQWLPNMPSTSTGAVADAWRLPEDTADFIGVDTYTSNWSWDKEGQALPAKTDFQRWLNTLHPPISKVLVVERGISCNSPHTDEPAAAQATILREDYNYLIRCGAYGLMYWNSGGATDNSVYLLGPPAQRVFKQIAIAAATVTPPPDRYEEGYADGLRVGRAGAFAEVAAWAASQR